MDIEPEWRPSKNRLPLTPLIITATVCVVVAPRRLSPARPNRRQLHPASPLPGTPKKSGRLGLLFHLQSRCRESRSRSRRRTWNFFRVGVPAHSTAIWSPSSPEGRFTRVCRRKARPKAGPPICPDSRGPLRSGARSGARCFLEHEPSRRAFPNYLVSLADFARHLELVVAYFSRSHGPVALTP